MTQDLEFSCTCGKTHWVLNGISPDTASRAKCYCKDCQAFARHLGKADFLDTHGGTDLNQAAGDKVEFTKGCENIGVLQLSPKGLLRWHTTCCNTPIANTMASTTLGFASLLLQPNMDSHILGAVKSHVNVGTTNGALKQRGLWLLVRKFLGRMICARLTRSWRQSAFFDDDLSPIATPRVLTLKERQDATPG